MSEDLSQAVDSSDFEAMKKALSAQDSFNPKFLYDMLWLCHIQNFKEGFDHLLSLPLFWSNPASSLQDAYIVHIVRSMFSDLGASFVGRYLDQLALHTSSTPTPQPVSLYLLISACVDTIQNSEDLVKSIIMHKRLEACPHISRISPRLMQLWEGSSNKKSPPSNKFCKEECLAHLQTTAHPIELLNLMAMEAYVHVSLNQDDKKASHEKVFRWVQQWCHNKPSSWFDRLEQEWLKDEEKTKMVEHVFGEQKQHIDDIRLKQDLQPLIFSPSLPPDSRAQRKM